MIDEYGLSECRDERDHLRNALHTMLEGKLFQEAAIIFRGIREDRSVWDCLDGVDQSRINQWLADTANLHQMSDMPR